MRKKVLRSRVRIVSFRESFVCVRNVSFLSVFIRVYPWLRLKVSRFLTVFHRRFARLVIRARAAFGDAGGGDFGDDVVNAVRARFNHTRADHVRDGADTHNELLGRLVRLWASAVKRIGLAVGNMRRRDWQPLAAATERIPAHG